MSIYDSTVDTQINPAAIASPTTPVMTSSEANQVLSTYGVDPNQVLSATNVANTLTRPTAAPDDLLGIRSQINYDLGLDAQNTAYVNALAAARTKVNDLNKTTAVMEGQRVNLGVIRGEQGQARTLAAPEIEALQYQAALESDKLNALTKERDYRVSVAEKNIDFVRTLKLEYPGAKIGFGDSLDKIESKLVKFKKEQKKEAEKDAMKEAYFKLTGERPKAMSSDELRKKLAKKSKEALKTANKKADLENQKLEMDIKNIESEIAKRKSDMNGGGTTNIASLFGDSSQDTGNTGSLYMTSSGVKSYNDPLSFYLDNQ